MIQHPNTNTWRIFIGQWRNWAITMSSFIVLIILSSVMSKTWLAIPTWLMAYTLVVYSRHRSSMDAPGCIRILRYGAAVLTWSGAIMAIIVLMNTHVLLDGLIDWSASNRQIPYIVCLILSPVSFFMALWYLYGDTHARFCARCYGRMSHTRTSNVVGRIYDTETRFQLQLLLLVNFIMGAVQWWYFFEYYINVNFNSPDKFFFKIMPGVMYVFLIFLLLIRYSNLSRVIGPLGSTSGVTGSVVRYLVHSGDQLLLNVNPSMRWETPAIAVASQPALSTADGIRSEFEKISGIKDAAVRQLYVNTDADGVSRVYHFLATVPDVDGAPAKGKLEGEWFNIDQIDHMIKSATMSVELADEIYRIYTIMMAWKTYTPDGKRRYPIRHYRPAFRLGDIQGADVDFNDLSWFDVAGNNEDRPFFRTRRLWLRLTGQRARR